MFVPLLFIVFNSAFSYTEGPGGEIFLIPESQVGRPWDTDIDEKIRDDSDFIQSRPLGKSAQDYVDFKFSHGVDAHQNTSHVLQFVYKRGNVGTNSPHLTMTFREGDKTIEEWTYDNIPTTFTLVQHELSPENAKNITNYSNLYITINAWCDHNCLSKPGNKEVVQISWLNFSYHRSYHTTDALPPSVVGVGIYQIKQDNVTNPYLENTLKHDGLFSTYQPYSSSTDETDLLRYGQTLDYEKFGTFFFLSDEKTFVPITTGVVGRPIQLQILMHDDQESEQIQHMGLSVVASGQSLKQNTPLFEIEMDKGKKPSITDKHDILEDVFTSWSVEEGHLWTNIDLIFKQTLPKSDFIIQIWDQGRIPQEFKLPGILEVLKSDKIKQDEKIDLTADVIMSHNAASPVCKLNQQCFLPFNAKILKSGIVTWINHDETVHSVVSGNGEPNNRFSYYVFPGQSAQHRFDESGEYNYYCDLHPWAHGKVTVYDQDQQITMSSEKTDVSPISVYSVSTAGSLLVENNDVVVKDNRNLQFVVSGHISEDISRKRVELMVTNPYGVTTLFHVSANRDGYYSMPIVLNKTWMPGDYVVIAKIGNIEIGHVSFSVTSIK